MLLNRLETFYKSLRDKEKNIYSPTNKVELLINAILDNDTEAIENIKPMLKDELYLSTLLTGEDIDLLPKPVTRLEYFLYSAIKGIEQIYKAENYIEIFLTDIALAGGVSIGGIMGTLRFDRNTNYPINVFYDEDKDIYWIQSEKATAYKWASWETTGNINQEYVFETDVYGVSDWFTYRYDASAGDFPLIKPVLQDITIDLPFLQKLKFNYIPIENDPNKYFLIYVNNPYNISSPAEARVFLQGLKTYKYEGETNHFNIRKVQGVAGFGLNVNIFTGSFESIKNGSAKGTASTTDLINMENNIMYNVDIKIEPNSRNFGLYLWAKNDLSMRNFIFTGNKLLNTQGNFNTNCKFLNVINEPMQFASYFLSNSTVGNVCIISKLRISTIQNYFNITNVNEKSNVDILNDIENNKVTLTKNAEGQFGNVKYNIPNLKDNTKYYVFVDNLNNIGNVYIEASQGFKSKERIKLNEAIPTNTDENMPSLQAEVPTGTKYELEFIKEPSKTYKLVLETTENAPIGTVSEFDKMYIWTDDEIMFNYLNGYQNMRVNQTYDNTKGIVRMEVTGAGTYNYGGIGLTELDFGTYEIHFNVYANNGYNTFFNNGAIRTTSPVLADITIDIPLIERKILTFTIDETNKGLLKLLFYYGETTASSSVEGDLIYIDDISIYKKE